MQAVCPAVMPASVEHKHSFDPSPGHAIQQQKLSPQPLTRCSECLSSVSVSLALSPSLYLSTRHACAPRPWQRAARVHGAHRWTPGASYASVRAHRPAANLTRTSGVPKNKRPLQGDQREDKFFRASNQGEDGSSCCWSRRHVFCIDTAVIALGAPKPRTGVPWVPSSYPCAATLGSTASPGMLVVTLAARR